MMAAGLLMTPVVASGQQSSVLSMSVTADVANGLSVFVENHLSFGTVLTGSGVRSVALTDPAAGMFRINGRNNRDIDVTLSPPATLTNGVHTIPYTWQAAYNNTTQNAATATTVAATAFQAQLKHHISGNISQAYVWAYGSIDLGTSPSPLSGGLYQGTFVISVAY
jgi:hypothetical protein